MNKNNAKIFWDWFAENQVKYYVIDSVDEETHEELLNDFLEHLHQYCDALYFEMSGNRNDTQELIISADGADSLFNVVDELVAAAPQVKNWKFISLKPPVEGDFEINYEGAVINTKNAYCVPLEPDESDSSQKIGVRFYIESYNSEQDLRYRAAAWLVLDSVFGERACAENIDYVEVKEIPNPDMIDYNVKKGALYPLSELKRYVEKRKASYE